MACASILCGKNLGVAPGVTLHYFAVPDDGNNTYNYCLALEELLKVNAQLLAFRQVNGFVAARVG